MAKLSNYDLFMLNNIHLFCVLGVRIGDVTLCTKVLRLLRHANMHNSMWLFTLKCSKSLDMFFFFSFGCFFLSTSLQAIGPIPEHKRSSTVSSTSYSGLLPLLQCRHEDAADVGSAQQPAAERMGQLAVAAKAGTHASRAITTWVVHRPIPRLGGATCTNRFI